MRRRLSVLAFAAGSLFVFNAVAMAQVAPLQITTTSLANWDDNLPGYSQTVGTIGGRSPFTFSVSSGAFPPGLNLNGSNGAITGTPTQIDTFPFTIMVTDADSQTASRAFSITINQVVSINNAPTLPSGAVNESYAQSGSQLGASWGSGGYIWSVPMNTLPAGLSLNSSTGAITGISTTAGNYGSVPIMVTDSLGQTATTTFSITINPQLAIAPVTLPVGVAGISYNGPALQASGGSSGYGWSLASGTIGNGTLAFQPGGNFSGTPTTPQTIQVTVKVTDALGGTATMPVTLTVNPPLSITTSVLPTAVQGYPYSVPIQTAGGSGGNNWVVYSGTLPTGININNSGVLTGTTTVAPGNFTFQLRATDSDNENALSPTYVLTVAAPVSITTTTLPNGAFGDTYSQTIATSGGTGNFTWSIFSGALPTGVGINPTTGVISGTATQNGFPANTAANINVTVQVTDAVGDTATQAYSFLIEPTLAVSTAIAPAAVEGDIYSATLAATGGSGTFTWSITPSNALPAGLSLTSPATGTIGGTATVTGSFPFTATVTDSNGGTASKALTLYVNATGKLITSNLLPGMTIVNVSGTQDGALNFNSGQTIWYSPYSTTQHLLEYTVQPGTYTFRVIDSADAQAIFPNLTAGQASSMGTSWTYNTPWVTCYLVFDSSAATNGSVGQIFSGSENGSGVSSGTAMSNEAAAYASALTNGTYNELFVGTRNSQTPVKQYQFMNQETLIFAVPDNDLGDNGGGVSVLIAPVAPALVIPGENSISSLPAGQAGTPYTPVPLTASGGSGVYQWSNSMTNGPLPLGMSISAAGVIAGTPTVMGAFPRVLLTVTDPVSGASQGILYSLQIAAPASPLTITTGSLLPGAQLNMLYGQTIHATGGLGTYTWSMAPVGNASGLTINSASGLISGTIATPGTYSFTVTVADTATDTAQMTFSVSALGLTTSTLPAAIEGESYSQLVTAAGATGGVTWTISAGALPAGLQLVPSTGNIIGVPTSLSNPASFAVTATDSASNTAFKLFSIPVSRPTQVSYMLADRGAGLISISGDGSNTAVFVASASGDDVAQEAGGNFIVAALTSLLRVTPNGNVTTVAHAPGSSIWIAVAIDGAGNIIAVDNSQHAVWRVSPDGSSIVNVANYPAPLPNNAEDAKVLVDTHGNYVVAEDNGGSARIFVIAPGGSPAEVSLSTAPTTVGGFTSDRSGNYILEDNTTGTLYQITPGGSTTTLATGVSGQALARNPVTNTYEVASSGSVVEVSGANHAPLFSGSPLFNAPRGMIAVTSDFVSTVDATNPLGYFRLETPSGLSEVNGLPYQFSMNGATLGNPGAPIGEATGFASLDGNSGAVTTGATADIGTAGSVMAWVNLAALPSCDPNCNSGQSFRYVAGQSTSGNDFDVQFSNDNVLRFYTTDAGANISYTPNPATLAGQWHMIVTTFDAGAIPATRAIYWDGQLVASDNALSFTNKPGSFEIGASNVFTGRNFHGGIDEVGLWNYALTPAEVYRMFAETSGTFGLPSAPTVLSLGPNTAPANSASVALIISGQNLSGTTGVWWTPAGGQTTVLALTSTAGNTLVTATVPGSLLTAMGTAEVSVVTGTVPSNQVPFTISGSPVSITTGSSLPDAMQYQVYSAGIGAAGGSGNYAWVITSQDAGLNLSIDGFGNLSGTPTSSSLEGLNLTVTVTDTTTSQTASQGFTIIVDPGFPPAPAGPQPSGTSAYVLDENGAISSVVGGVSNSFANFDGCEPNCADMARDTLGRFVVASGDSLQLFSPGGQFIFNIEAPEGSNYFSVAADGLGNYIVADTANHQLLRIVPGSGADMSVTSEIGNWRPAEGSVFENAYVKVDGSGNYILTVDDQDESNDQPILRLFTSTPAGPLVPVALSGASQPASTGDLTFDANGNYVDTDWWNAAVYTITPAGASTVLYSNPNGYLSTPRGITRDPASGDFLLVDEDLDALYSLTPDGQVLNLLAQYGTLGVPGSVLVADTVPSHVIDYVLTDSSPGAIVPVGGGTTLNCSPCGGYVSDFTTDAQGNFIVASEEALVKITPGGGACPQGCVILSPVGNQNFFSVAIDSAGNYIVGDNFNHQLLKVTPGLPGTVTNSIPYAVNEEDDDAYEDVFVRIDAAGNYVVAEDNDEDNPVSIIVIPPTATNSPAPLALTPGLPLTSIPTTFLGGMTLDATGRYVITDDNTGQIYAVSQSGAFNILYSNPENIFGELAGIYLDPLSGNFLLTDYENDNLYTMDQAGTQITLVQSGVPNPVVALAYPTALTVISSTTLPGGTANQFYSTAAFMAQGGSGNYTWSAAGLPGTLTMSAAGVISGTPTAAFSSNNIVVTVTDTSNNNATAMKTFSLTIVPGANVFSITQTSLPGGTTGAAYTTTTFAATGGSGHYTWRATGIPFGLTFNSTGLLSGTPTASGVYSAFTVTVTDTMTQATATRTFSVTIAMGPLSITTSSLPGGVLNAAYGPFPLMAAGGSGNFTWSILNQPAGMNLSTAGILGGTPTSLGTFSTLRVTVVDTGNGNASLSATLPLTISQATILYPHFPAVSNAISGLTLNGNAAPATTPSGSVLRLTAASANQAGSAFATNGIQFQNAIPTFSTFFQFQITNPSGQGPGDGFVFVLQPSGPAAGGNGETQTGNGKGYLGITSSLGLAFETNPASPNVNQIGIVENGDVTLIDPTAANSSATCAAPVGVHGCLANGDVWSAWVDFDGTNLHVALADASNVRPADIITLQAGPTGHLRMGDVAALSRETATRLAPRAVESSGSLAALFDSSPLYAGFTGGTSSASENQDIVSWVFNNTYSPIVPPAITTSVLPAGTAGTPYSSAVAASGGSGPPYTFTAAGLPSPLTIQPGGTIIGTPAGPGSFPVTVTATDNATQLQVSQAYTLNISPAAPAVQPLSITSGSPPASGTVGVPYAFTFAASGGSGGYVWAVSGINGVTINPNTGALSGSPASSGSLTLTVTLTDAANSQNTISQGYNVTIAAAPLAITTNSLPGGTENQPYSATLGASGGSGNYTFSVSGITGLTVSGNRIGGSPTVGGNLTLTVTVNDALNPSATPATRQYQIAIVFAPLTITTSGALGEFAPNAAISTTFAATGGSPALTWSATGVPAALTLIPATGQIMGNAPAKPGNYSFPLKVSDTETPIASDSTTVTLSVLGITTPATLPQGTTSTNYSLNFVAEGGTPPYSFSSTNLPSGLTLSSSGFLTGTPAKPVTSSFQVMVSDASGIPPVATTFSLNVVTGVQPIQVTGAALPDGAITASYSQPLEAQNGQPSYNWMLLGGALPPGLALSSSGTISGTPTATGQATFTARATDATGGFAAGVFTINVNPAALQITAAALPNAMAGLPYGAQPINATGGVPPYSFAITEGSLPSPLTFSSGQINTGVPAASGTSNFTVTVTDATGNTASGAFALLVEATQPDLILSQASVSFALVAGQTVMPPSANVTVGSSVSNSLGYNVLVNPPANWLDVTPIGDTLGTTGGAPVVIGLDQTNAPALSVGLHQTTVTVACLPFSGCSGSHNITVSVTVTSPAPQLSLGTNLLSFSAAGNGSPTLAQPLNLQNTGGGVVTIQSVSAADSWVKFDTSTIPPPTMPLAAGQTLQVNVFADTTVLSGPGYYQSTITVTTDAGTATVPVTLLIAATATMTLSPAGSQFNTVAGNAPGNSNGSFLVSVSGNSTVNWTAAVTTNPAPAWLTLNTLSGSSASGSPGTIGFTINGAAANLPAQAYYATIEVTAAASDNISNPVRDYQVILNVAQAGNIAAPNPDPAGLIFISTGQGPLPAQIVSVGSSSGGVTYSAQSDSPSWLLVSPASGPTSSSKPGQSNVSVNPAGLPTGVYHGGIGYTIAGQVRTVNVTLIVAAPTATPSISGGAISGVSGKASSPGCTATQLIPAQTGLVNNFSLPTAWPTPLQISVLDDCGKAVTTGQVVATFSNGDPPLVLPATGGGAGVYSGTWTPRATASQVTITAQASAPGFKPASIRITGQVTRNSAPVLNPGGSLNAFVPVVGSPLAPGMIVQIYGSNLASQTVVGSTIPLANSLNNTSVIIGGQEAPLYFVSPGQINAQVPFGLAPGTSYEVIVNANGALSTPNAIQLAGDAPGVAAYAGGAAIAEHADGSLVTEASPAAPGEAVVFFASGLGVTDNPVVTGAASPGSPLARPTDQPTLTLNGVNVPVAFAGLTPTLVGLYQVNFNVPADAPNGDLQLVLTQAGGSSTTILPVHN